MGDGRLNKCRECCKKYELGRRCDPVIGEQLRERDRSREYSRWRRKRRQQYQRRHRKQNPDKYRARMAVGNALRDGALIRLPCAICGDPLTQEHHRDYAQPLDVTWYCFKHQRELAHDRTISPGVSTQY